MARIKIVSAPADSIEKQGKPYPYDSFRGSGSLPEIPKISTKIKPINEEDANSEIERGEIVLNPETGTMHKALGKPHSQGGTPVNLSDGSFIFSNYKNLAFSKKQKELFEFKMGGNKMKNNTPAKILEKEVDLKHHNKMIDVLQNDGKYDALTNNSAKLMMMKNLEKAGQIAFLQETKKNQPAPGFAQDTAPVYSSDTNQDITQSLQYLQAGGLTAEEKLRARRNKLADTKGWHFRYKEDKTSYFDKPTTTDGKKMSNEDWIKFLKSESAQHKADRFARQNNDFGYIEDNVDITPGTPYEPRTLTTTPRFQAQITSPKPSIDYGPGNKPGKADGIVDSKTYNTKLTPWQKLNLAIPFYRAATVKTQYPIRQHQESVIPQFENQNVQPMLNENNQGYFNAANLTRTLNPTQASSYLQQLYGNRISANNQAIGNVQNNNIQIQNRQKEMAAGTMNQDAAANRAFDSRFYDQTQVATKNARDLRESYEQQGINNINETMTKKLAFDSWLNTQQQYRGKKTYIDKDGVQHYEGVTPYSPQAGFFGYSVKHNPTNIDWSTYQSTLNNKVDSPEEIQAAYQKFREIDPTFKLSDFFKNRNFMQYMQTNPYQSPSFKRGGKYRNPKPKTNLYY